jgi:hypothetical protein
MRSYRTRWEDGARCGETNDPEAHFELENAIEENRMADVMRVSIAMHACEVCPVIERCFREAVFSRSLGIWGGTTAAERGIYYKLAGAELERSGE